MMLEAQSVSNELLSGGNNESKTIDIHNIVRKNITEENENIINDNINLQPTISRIQEL